MSTLTVCTHPVLLTFRYTLSGEGLGDVTCLPRGTGVVDSPLHDSRPTSSVPHEWRGTRPPSLRPLPSRTSPTSRPHPRLPRKTCRESSVEGRRPSPRLPTTGTGSWPSIDTSSPWPVARRKSRPGPWEDTCSCVLDSTAHRYVLRPSPFTCDGSRSREVSMTYSFLRRVGKGTHEKIFLVVEITLY